MQDGHCVAYNDIIGHDYLYIGRHYQALQVGRAGHSGMKKPCTTYTPIDKNSFVDLDSYEGQKKRAIKIRLADLRSNPGKRAPGANKIIQQMQIEAVGKQINWISEEHLRRHLPKTLEGNEVEYFDLDDAEPFLRSYLQRFELVKTIFNIEGRLTQDEAEAAERVYYEFSDPYGETVDLIPQCAIIYELAQRKANKRPVHDIDSYFAHAPWKSGVNKDLYSFALNQGKAIPPQLRLVCPFIPTEEPPAILTDKPTPSAFDRHLVLVGAHAHLGMPYALNYSTPIGSGKNPTETGYMLLLWESSRFRLEDMSINEYRNRCRWQVQLKAAITGKLTPAVQVTDYRNTLAQDDLQDDIDRLDKRIADAKSESEASND